jgi:plastocyanin
MKRAWITTLLAVSWLMAAPCAPGAELQATVRDGVGHLLSDAVVLAYPEDFHAPPPKPVEEIEDQVNKEFVPYVKPVSVGSRVRFPNRDNISHHVYSFSPAKRFELPLYKGTPAVPVLFDKVGVVKLGCNIHDWMIGYLYVTDAPYFGKSGDAGRVELTDLPPGNYRVRVWHPRMEAAEDATVQRIVLQDSAPATVEWQLKLKREYRPSRTPLPGEPGYR